MINFVADIIKAVEGTVGELGSSVETIINASRNELIQKGESQEVYEARLNFLSEEKEKKERVKLEQDKVKAELKLAKAEQKNLQRKAKFEARQAHKEARAAKKAE